MSFDSNFLPGKAVLWNGQRHFVVDCQDMQHVLVQEPGKRKLWRAPIGEISAEPRSIGDTFNPPELQAVTDQAWRAALERYQRLQPLIEMDPAKRTFVQVKAIADAEGRHPATIYRWIEEYQRTRRVSCFLKKPRSDQGTTRISEELEKIVEKAIKTKYLTSEKPDIVDVVEEVELQCRKRKLKPPHDNTVRRRISLVSERTKLEKRQGRDAAENKFDPMLGHFPGADHPLAVVQMDHTPMDIIVVDEEDRKPINRPYLTIVIDVFSRMILGFAIYLEKPSAFTSGLAISHAVLTKDEWLDEMGVKAEWPCWGRFRKLHCDNAKEFRGTVIGRACEEHKITVEHRPKGIPRYGGHVERGFRTFMRRLHTVKGTTFSDIKERAKYDSSGKAIMTRGELERWFTIYIAKYYPNKFHRGIKDTPLHRYKAGILGTDGHMGIGLPERIQNPGRFMLDFMPFKERSVQDYGILLNHVYYYDDALRHWIRARDPDNPNDSREFIVRYNPRKMHEVYFYDPTSKDYITIPYRDRSHPPASWWEIQAAVEKLNREGRKHVNEDLIFEAIEEMREIEDEAERITKGARRNRERRKYQPTMPAKLGTASTQPTAVPKPIEPAVEDAVEPDGAPISPYEGIVEPD